MAAAPKPLQVLRANRLEAIALSGEVGWQRMKKVLETAQKDLEFRLEKASSSRGPGMDSFTVTDLKMTLAQVKDVLRTTRRGMKGAIVDTGKEAARAAAGGVIQYLQASEQQFKGIHRRLPLREGFLFDRAVAGTDSSLLHRLEADPVRGPGILDRYGDNVVQNFEHTLQQRFIAQTPWADVRKQLVEKSPFLQQAPAHWAERIVRTEVMGAHGRASWETLRTADAELGGGTVKILSATFDDRTGSDSYAVHGQIRRPEEAFAWWGGSYQHPPNRPNDREVVVPHRIDWPIPDGLKWKSDGEIAARWAKEGKKGGPPGRPLMTTVPIELFGKPTAAPKQVQVPEQLEPAVPPAPPIEEPPAIPPKPERGPIASPFFEGELVSNAITTGELLLHEKVSGPKGSNEGGVYRTPSGEEHYVKFYSDPVQPLIEHLTNNIYDDLGLGSVKSHVFEHEGKLAYASKIIEGETLAKKVPPLAGYEKLDKKLAKQVMKGFVADVLTGNWDAVGTGLDNVLVTPYGRPIRIDTGGSLLMRAKAGRKPAHMLNQITEWEKLFDSGVNPHYAKVAQAAGYSSARDIAGIKDQIKAVLAMRKTEPWKDYVERVAPGLAPDDKRQIVEMLDARTDLLEQKLKELSKRKPKGEVKFEDLKQQSIPERLSNPVGMKSYEYVNWKDEQRSKLRETNREQPGFIGAVERYTGSEYRAIRDAGAMTEAEWKKKHGGSQYDHFRDLHDRIDRGFDKGSTDIEDRITDGYRGINSVSRSVVEKLAAAKTFEVEALSSVSWDPAIARTFGHDGSGSTFAVLFHYKFKKGTRNKLAVEAESMHESEKELLLRKGAKFRIVSAHRMEGRNQTLLLVLEEE